MKLIRSAITGEDTENVNFNRYLTMQNQAFIVVLSIPSNCDDIIIKFNLKYTFYVLIICIFMILEYLYYKFHRKPHIKWNVCSGSHSAGLPEI